MNCCNIVLKAISVDYISLKICNIVPNSKPDKVKNRKLWI